MILIADSGSTKTDWRLIEDKKEVQKIDTIGLNPYFIKLDEIVSVLQKELIPGLLEKSISKIFFYGAGCSSVDNNKIIQTALNRIIPDSKIEVNHDILGAARSLCGKEKGIAAILGTGSNACYYNGKDIEQSLLSLAYVLGDEGGADHMGKILLKAYLSDDMPEELSIKFNIEYKLSKQEILDCIYKKPSPNKFLASFAPFLSANKEHPFIYNIIYSSLNDFFDKQLSKLLAFKKVPLGCIGSVGFVFKEILIKVAQDWGTTINKVEKNPMEGLIKYHTVS